MRSRNLDWDNFQPHRNQDDEEEIFTIRREDVKRFLYRHQHVTDVRLHNVLLVKDVEDRVLCDRKYKSPAMQYLHQILAPLSLQSCHVVMDTFKYFDDSELIWNLDKETELLREKIGAPFVINETDECSKVATTYDSGPWLLETTCR